MNPLLISKSVQSGVSLLELVVSSALMGVLFISGLQLLTSMEEAQSRLITQNKGSQNQPDELHLEQYLRQELQDAVHIDISEASKTLRYQKQNSPQASKFEFQENPSSHKIILQRVEGDDKTIISSWKQSNEPISTRFTFKHISARMISIAFADTRKPVMVWLRNQQ